MGRQTGRSVRASRRPGAQTGSGSDGQSETSRNQDSQTETERKMPVGDPKRPGTPRESAGPQRCTHPGTSTEATRGKLRQRAQRGESQGKDRERQGADRNGGASRMRMD